MKDWQDTDVLCSIKKGAMVSSFLCHSEAEVLCFKSGFLLECYLDVSRETLVKKVVLKVSSFCSGRWAA